MSILNLYLSLDGRLAIHNIRMLAGRVWKVLKQNGAHELFMNTHIVAGQRYYYIDVEC